MARGSSQLDQPIPLRSKFLCTLTGEVGSPMEVGVMPQGERRIVPIEGGHFDGPRLRGRVLPFGADWMSVRPDKVLAIDCRAVLETHDKALISMCYTGFRYGPPSVMEALGRGESVDPSEYYFRIAPTFETGSDEYSWLNRIVAVGIGRRVPSGPIYDIYEII
jgi:Protein of unknown function (DUF3237)